VVDYMGTADASRWAVVDGETVTYPQIANALAAEFDAQAQAVGLQQVTSGRNASLDEALCRRVVRNLAMRSLTLAVMPGNLDAGTGPTRPSMLDPEVRRLEGPYRRLPRG